MELAPTRLHTTPLQHSQVDRVQRGRAPRSHTVNTQCHMECQDDVQAVWITEDIRGALLDSRLGGDNLGDRRATKLGCFDKWPSDRRYMIKIAGWLLNLCAQKVSDVDRGFQDAGSVPPESSSPVSNTAHLPVLNVERLPSCSWSRISAWQLPRLPPGHTGGRLW